MKGWTAAVRCKSCGGNAWGVIDQTWTCEGCHRVMHPDPMSDPEAAINARHMMLVERAFARVLERHAKVFDELGGL